ncbi:unnamed protein product, partial [Anisakis simplex]|uniref:Uncharacterized protein n=1 Tax=Anisakis simplex TaxID=6269 RepID=A0A0M3JEX3_ANISI
MQKIRIPGSTQLNAEQTEQEKNEEIPEDIHQFYGKLEGEEDDDDEAIQNLQLLTFEIKQESIEIVQKRCIELEYPLLAEYD